MAKKLDVDIDPGKFLDSFRPEMPAPATTGNKEVKDSCEKDTVPAEGCPTDWKETDNESTDETEYIEKFLQPAKGPVRSAKSAYIRPEFHERIQRIVRVIGKNDLSLSVYVDHVLEHHFKENEEVIRRLYNKNYEDIY